jgi:hypothetical protein
VRQNGEQHLARLNEDPDLVKVFQEPKLRHAVLDFYLPHEFGGLSDPLDPRYAHLNIFPETMDLPLIKPKTTVNNKNEFNGK